MLFNFEETIDLNILKLLSSPSSFGGLKKESLKDQYLFDFPHLNINKIIWKSQQDLNLISYGKNLLEINKII